MKRTFLSILCLLMAVLMLMSGCTTTPDETPDPTPDEGADVAGDETVDPELQPDPEPQPEPVETDFRVIISSDIHCTHLLEWYGVNYRDRMQMWVDAILYEHEQDPIDLIILNGDLSLDHWLYNKGGTWLSEGVSTTEEFVEDFVSQLPEEIPIFIMPGNHEQFGNDDWWFITGNDRQEYTVLGNNLFIMPDTFAGELDPDYNHDGVYTGVDMDFVNAAIAEHPDKDIWLIGHYFDMSRESAEFKELLRTNERIKGLFHGHIHVPDVQELGAQYNDLTIAVTGNFAYTKAADVLGSFWGFRDLVITADGASSRYIIADSEAVIDGKEVVVEREEINEVKYDID
ncbi:MAG: metallophosphoesterase [Clostridia bacterium]|nr:metallophosphoesterase [Clostridia bacterium]